MLRKVEELLCVIEELLTCREQETRPAVDTLQLFVSEIHTPPTKPRVREESLREHECLKVGCYDNATGPSSISHQEKVVFLYPRMYKWSSAILSCGKQPHRASSGGAGENSSTAATFQLSGAADCYSMNHVRGFPPTVNPEFAQPS